MLSSQFAIFANARTGSSTLYYFFEGLGVSIVPEPFHGDNRPESYDLRAYLLKLYDRYDAMKHLYPHLDPDSNLKLLDMLAERNIKIIYLKRRNHLLNALSKAIAWTTWEWGVGPEEEDRKVYLEKCANTPVPIDLIKQHMNRNQEFEAKYDDHLKDRDVFEVYYEELYNVPFEQTLEKLHAMLDFLGLTPDEDIGDLVRRLFDSSRKQNTPEVFSHIPNIKEIEETFSITLTK